MSTLLTKNVVLIYSLYWLLLILFSLFIIPKSEKVMQKLYSSFLIIIMATIIPLFGPFVVFVYAVFLRSILRQVHEPNVEKIQIPSIMRDARLTMSTAAPGSIAARLRHARNPRQRLEAISQIADSQFSSQSQLLRGALSDDAEEVRLLAYAALDRREQENTELLIHLNKQMKLVNEPKILKRIQDSRYWLYWSISHSEAHETTSDTTPSFSKWEPEFLNISHDSASMKMLFGLYLLQVNKIDEAITSLKAAENSNIAGAVIAPYLASAYFYKRDLKKIREIYRQHSELRLSPRYGPSMSYWLGDRK
ncbi:HEAT repeat domain-containing protein [Acidithiobacillus montserratensis]|uniref:HEAT repeat domain-containing protein n=1 Tax=Acidithiobacillus montserratensis TaxID=2729135 RepID=A0ACD5HF70_9PROT|nr:HEAT repeat domain-containing protein [Acidithiobacillus montserratensis]MBU2746993.1 HEAT repeat domain-containing protein [Acidithiobacillus montserratensis]